MREGEDGLTTIIHQFGVNFHKHHDTVKSYERNVFLWSAFVMGGKFLFLSNGLEKGSQTTCKKLCIVNIIVLRKEHKIHLTLQDISYAFHFWR